MAEIKRIYKTLGVTGNRPHKIPQPLHSVVQERINAAIYGFAEQGGEKVLQGAALGVDQWVAESVLGFNAEPPPTDTLQLYSYIPFRGQENGWKDWQKQEYYKMLSQSAVLNAEGVPGNQNLSHNQLYHARNRRIVDDSDIMLAVCSETAGSGAYSTLKYARKQGKPVIWIKVEEDRLVEDFLS